MDIVECCWSVRACQEFAHNFCEIHCEEIKRVMERFPIEIVMESGDRVLVMTYKTYETWCKGRTYKHYGEDEIIYHSGFAFHRRENQHDSDDS